MAPGPRPWRCIRSLRPLYGCRFLYSRGPCLHSGCSCKVKFSPFPVYCELHYLMSLQPLKKPVFPHWLNSPPLLLWHFNLPDLHQLLTSPVSYTDFFLSLLPTKEHFCSQHSVHCSTFLSQKIWGFFPHVCFLSQSSKCLNQYQEILYPCISVLCVWMDTFTWKTHCNFKINLPQRFPLAIAAT